MDAGSLGARNETPTGLVRTRSFVSATASSPALSSLAGNVESLATLLQLGDEDQETDAVSFDHKLISLKNYWIGSNAMNPLPVIPTDIMVPKEPHAKRQHLRRSASSYHVHALATQLSVAQTLESIELKHILGHTEDLDLDVRPPPLVSDSLFQPRDTMPTSHQSLISPHCNAKLQEDAASTSKEPKTNLETPKPPQRRPIKHMALEPPALSRHSTCFDRSNYIGPYKVIKNLGSGAFSNVHLAVDPETDGYVALKCTKKGLLQENPNMNLSVENEVSTLALLNHPNIVKLIDSFETRQDVVIVLEYVEGGELFSLIAHHFKQVNQERAKRIFRQIAAVVQHLHSKNICHRDLKLENILIDKKDNVKLTDFGFAKTFDPATPLVARCGSEEYAAPEIILGAPYDGRKVDVWALGVVLFAMLVGELPFVVIPGERPKAMIHRIARGEFRFPEDRRDANENTIKLPPLAKNLICGMLTRDAQRRFFIEDVLRHGWLSEP